MGAYNKLKDVTSTDYFGPNEFMWWGESIGLSSNNIGDGVLAGNLRDFYITFVSEPVKVPLTAYVYAVEDSWNFPVETFNNISPQFPYWFSSKSGFLPPRFGGYVKFNSSSPVVSGELIGTGDGTTTSFNATLIHSPIKKSSITVHYTISSTDYTATDDGNGNISGTDCSGTIDYDTGAISLTFTTAPDSGTNITVDYDYKVRVRMIVWAR